MEKLNDGQAKLLEQIHLRNMMDQDEEQAEEKLRIQQELIFYRDNIILQEMNLQEKF